MLRDLTQKIWFSTLLSLVAGGFAALGQAPWSLWPVAVLGYGLAVWLIVAAPRPRQAAWRGWLVGLSHFALSLHWITEPFQVDAARDGWMAPFALAFLAAGLALFWGAGAWMAAAQRLVSRGLAVVLALSALEAFRGVVFTGFPWALPGHIWLGHAPEQLAALFGAGGLTVLTLLIAGLPTIAGRRGTLVAALLLAGAFSYGQWRGQLPQPADRDVVVRLVQPNADQALKWDPEHLREFFERQLDLSAAPAARRPDLIVWPETSVAFLLNDPGYGLEVMLKASGDVPLAVGIQRTEGMRGFNSLAVIGRGADQQPEVMAAYDKHHLVPFGEYIPMGDLLADWLGVFSFSPSNGYGYSAGPAPQLMSVAGLPVFQPLICYEAVFPYFQHAVARPEWLLQVTNDSWFGDRAGPYQHAAINRLRAIESGLPLVRVANTGLSFVVDGRGHLRGELALNTMGHLDMALPAPLPETFYAKFGATFAILLWFGLAGLAFIRQRLTPLA